MAITGSQKAYTYALSGVARSGATRSGYVSAHVYISIGGGAFTGSVAYGSLTITDSLDEVPNRCTFRVYDVIPATGQAVLITLGSTNGGRLFAGHVLTVDELIGGLPTQIRADVSCVDYTWQLGFLKVTKRYSTQSATAIAQDLIATYAAVNGFTSTGVVAGLPSVDEITFTNEDLPDALTRLCRRIGAYWYVDYTKTVQLFLEDARQRPTAITPTHPTLAIADFAYVADRSQALTRVYVEGRGTRIIAAAPVGETLVPLDAVDMFTPAADVFAKVSFQGSDGGAQHLSYTGVTVGGAGSLVGPGAGPPGAPTLALASGTGLSLGTYQYAYTDVTPTGESLPSPLATITTGVMPAPTTAPLVAAPTLGTGPEAGTHQYAVTFTTAAGETVPSPLSSVVTTGVPSIPNPTAAPIGTTPADTVFGNLVENGSYRVKYVYSTTTASPPVSVSLASPASAVIRANNSGGAATNAAIAVSIPCSPDPAVKDVWVYRTTNGGSTFYRGGRAVNVPGTYVDLGSTPSDAVIVTQGAEPVANTTPRLSVVPLTQIELGGAGVTGRKLYRTAANQATFKLLTTLADNTATTFTDTLADAALGAVAPTTNTAVAQQVLVSNIASGQGATNARKVYRTVANGSQLKRWWTIVDNNTTSGLDAIPDASLAENAPTGDTSGLTLPSGSVLAGATTIPVANAAAFPTAGWAIIGNGEQQIRFTGKSLIALTGIPPTGPGAITAAVSFNSTITLASMLTGIPASGVRSITRGLTPGDEIYLVVQVDDLARQAQLAAVLGGTGIREEWVQDRRLSITEARGRGQATLALRPLDQATLSYKCRDLATAAGKTIDVNLTPGTGSPINVIGTFKIQEVRIDNFRQYPTQPPTYHVTASTTRFSFEDWLRRIQTST